MIKTYQADITTYIHLSKYSRWRERDKRRETWGETVERLIEFWKKRYPLLPIEQLRDPILQLQVVPSMRTMMTAGKALDRDEVAAMNCSAVAVTHQRVFDEVFFLLMNGCGVGFSVERQYINRLPEISEEFFKTETVIKVGDSKIGWAKALRELIALLYNGQIPKWDLSEVRPEGARLKTFGGRASGPRPLDELMQYTVHLFKRAAGRKLNSLECHDLICKIADTVIVGSVRRSACISLSNLTDNRMRDAKSGEWYLTDPQRMLANNSVAYTEKPDLRSFMSEFYSLYASKAGERGMVNKVALKEKAASCGREYLGDYLLNPCGEAILRDSGGLCNLSEVIARPDDTLDTLKEKVRIATILGTLQSTLSNFRYLRKVWKQNQEEERLLGVSLTGIMDHPLLNRSLGVDILENALVELREVARSTNREWAAILGIPESKQLTLVKPSGTVSQLCGTSSGIHPRFSRYYLRRYTQDRKDPLTDLMISEGIPHALRGEKAIFTFPFESPSSSVVSRDIGAIEQLELWLTYKRFWCDGNPSQTIYYTDDEFLSVQDWIWKHWEEVSGLSFFPLDDFIYDREVQPYLEVTEEEYESFCLKMPKAIKWSNLSLFETEDGTQGNREVSCAGGACEL